jgi:PadR family transcriptional regulator PadR
VKRISGEFEMLLLAALVSVGKGAYGVTVHAAAQEIAGSCRVVSLSSIYTTLDRLEKKGIVRSKMVGPEVKGRGKRSTRQFEITAAGRQALDVALKIAMNCDMAVRSQMERRGAI